MKIALVAVPYDPDRFRIGESLGLKYLASVLISEGYEVDIFDLPCSGISIDKLLDALSDPEYILIGLSVQFTASLGNGLRIGSKIRKMNPRAHLTVGGHGISFLWEYVLERYDYFDSAVCFEGEATLLEIAAEVFSGRHKFEHIAGVFIRQKNGIRFSGFREPIADLDSLPMPLRDNGSKVLGEPHFAVISSRGCNKRCTFCSSGFFGNIYHRQPRWRARSAENVIKEIDGLVESWDALAISFVDDNFLGSCEQGGLRAQEIAHNLLAKHYKIRWSIECRADDVEKTLFRLMRGAGLEHVFLGIDSGNKEDLKLFGKGISLNKIEESLHIIRDLGFSLSVGFIMFHPSTTLDTLRENISFLRRNQLGSVHALTNRLEIYPGSSLAKFFSDEIVWDEDSAVYQYKFRPIVAIRNALRKCLKPFLDYELRISKATFAIQSGIKAINQDPFRRSEILSNFNKMAKEISTCEIELSERMVQDAQKMEKNILDTSETLLANLEKESNNFLDDIDKKLRELESYLTTP